MKIAIFHNFMDNIGGAEYVDLIMARELKADIYTTNIDKDKIKKMGFATDNIFSIGRVGLNSPGRQEVAYWKFRRLNLGQQYDFYIIAGDWAMSGALHHKPNLWYVYSPNREIWDLKNYTRSNIVPWYDRPLFDLWVLYRRLLNRYDVQEVQSIVTISRTVQQRVRQYLKRKSSVIYPPTETAKYYYQRNGNFWLSVNRLFYHKRVELQLKAFRKMPDEKLIIVGSFEKSENFKRYVMQVQKHKPPNVEIRSWVSQQELIELYANCRGLIATALDEDFGLTPVEAMASGKPVIAPNEGGYQETVIHGTTGILLNDMTAEALTVAIKELGPKAASYRAACQARAKQFDTSVFIDSMKKKIKTLL